LAVVTAGDEAVGGVTAEVEGGAGTLVLRPFTVRGCSCRLSKA